MGYSSTHGNSCPNWTVTPWDSRASKTRLLRRKKTPRNDKKEFPCCLCERSEAISFFPESCHACVPKRTTACRRVAIAPRNDTRSSTYSRPLPDTSKRTRSGLRVTLALNIRLQFKDVKGILEDERMVPKVRQGRPQKRGPAGVPETSYCSLSMGRQNGFHQAEDLLRRRGTL